MTRSEIVQTILTHTRRTEKAALALTAINLALSEMSQIHDFDILRGETDVQLSSGATLVALPDGVFQLRDIIVIDPSSTNGWRLQLRSKYWVTNRLPNLGVQLSSTPFAAYTEGNYIVVAPPSSRDLTLRVVYTQQFEALDEDAAEPAVNTIVNAIIAWATAYVFRSIEEFASADQWMREYGRALQHAITADRRRGETFVASPFRAVESEPIIDPWLDPFNPGEERLLYGE